MVQVNATGFTKVMLRRVGVPAVSLEVIRAFGDFDAGREGGHRRCLTAFAE